MTNQPLFRKIADLVANNKIAEAFSELEVAHLPSETAIDLILLKSRWNENERGHMLGTAFPVDYMVERARLVQAVLQLASRASDEEIQPSPSFPEVEDVDVRNTAQLEKIIGDSTLTPLAWFTKMVDASRSICRVVVDQPHLGNWVGTGFLTKNGYLFTNHHVLDSSDAAKYATLEFNYLTETSRRSVYRLDPSSWAGDKGLDFARVKVVDNPQEPLAQWGYLEIDHLSAVAPGDAVPIIQHPEGKEKQVSIEGNFVKRLSPDGKYLFYTTDTLPGSSGSPVFNKEWKVIALHHAGMSDEDLNRGILFKKIVERLGPDPVEKTPEAQAVGSIRVFWMYDEHAREYADGLKIFFSSKIKNKEIAIFDMHQDIGAEDIDVAISRELDAAGLVVCIITPRFMVTSLELAEKAREKGKPVVPVLISPVPTEGTFLERLATLPTRPKFAAEWSNSDAAYLDIFNGIKKILDRIAGKN